MKLHKLNIGSRYECNSKKGTLLSVMSNHAWADVQFDGETKTYISAGANVTPLDDQSKPKFAYNDGGRKESGRKGYSGDCVTRASVLLLDFLIWKFTIDLLKEMLPKEKAKERDIVNLVMELKLQVMESLLKENGLKIT